MYGHDTTQFMHRVRDAVDCKRIANRGKMLAMSEAPALRSNGPHALEAHGVIFRE
jgi:hypothetical protein